MNLSFCISDDHFGDYTKFEEITSAAIRNTWLFPFEDKTIFTSKKKATDLARQLQFEYGKALPDSYNKEMDTLSDESFSNYFFYSMGAVLLTKQLQQPTKPGIENRYDHSSLGPFVIDIPFTHTAMRPGFRPLASRIHFDTDQKVTAIYDHIEEALFKPGQPGWESAKFMAKSAAFTLITVREHLTWSHLLLSNSMTRACTVCLPPNHPIRRLLTVFIFRTTEVNTAAFDVLVPINCVLHRGVGYEYSALVELFEASYLSSNVFEPFPQRALPPALLEMAEAGNFPYWTLGKEYYQIVKTFVTEWIQQASSAAATAAAVAAVAQQQQQNGEHGEEEECTASRRNSIKTTDDKYARAFYYDMQRTNRGQEYELPFEYSEEALIEMLTTCIWTVTAYHELVGHVVDATLLPDRCGVRGIAGQTQVDLQAYLLTLVISSSTGIRMPQLMSPFENLFGAGGAPAYERQVWNTFQEELQKQSKRVQELNAQSKVPFQYFDPAHFECSISV